MSPKIRVLMVDDEEKFRIATQKILNRRGFDTLLAASGEGQDVRSTEISSRFAQPYLLQEYSGRQPTNAI